MKNLVFAASKGGVGKTTLAAAVAVEAARMYRVGVGDLDPQRALARWRELRERQSPTLLAGETMKDLVREATRNACEYLIVDTPPALMTHIAATVKLADLVVVPVRPSPLDVEAVEPVIELCRMYGKPLAFVISACPPRSKLTEQTEDYLKPVGRVLSARVAYRTEYPGAMIGGETPAELRDSAAEQKEIRDLWNEIRRGFSRAA